jgi:spore coat polysaccharide biosynthesis protein SpsF
MKTGIIIQARLGSTRLPNKMILPFYEDKGILQIILERFLSVIDISKTPIILATTVNPIDNEIKEMAESIGIQVFRGSELDVLDRFINAAEFAGISKIIRICADNPLLDVNEVQRLIKHSENSDFEYHAYATNDLEPTILTSYGFWGEYVTLNALQKIVALTQDKYYLEHVTNYIYTHPDKFKICFSTISSEIDIHKNIRLTVDTKTDFALVKEIYRDLIDCNIPLNAEAIVRFIVSKPSWMEIMQTEIMANKKS